MPDAAGGPAGRGADANELLRRARGGDRDAREAAVAANAGLVRQAVRRFAGPGRDAEELFQVGCIGLLKAVDRFDPMAGNAFATYAVPLILGELRHHLRDHGGLLRTGREDQGLLRRARRAEDELRGRLGREPSAAEVAAAVGVDVQRLVEAGEAAREPVSLDQPLSAEPGAATLGDRVADAGAGFADAVEVRDLLRRLPQRQAQVLALRFLRGASQSEVGRLLGVSQVQVSRIERRALDQLRRWAAPDVAGRRPGPAPPATH